MRYAKLGNTGLDVSRICLGAMGFGDPAGPRKWVVEEDAARPVVRRAVEAGITFFDTANVYSFGGSEEILGRALRDYANRDEIVIATKVHGRMHDGPNGQGLSRKAILAELDHSLRRLGTDYVDLYIIHRWDYDTPIEETMSTLNDVVRSGKVRYLGASAMFSWQLLTALNVSDRHGWERFVSMQNHYNLIYREEEREMMPLLRAQGMASTPYSPLANGRLTREWGASTRRWEVDAIGRQKYAQAEKTDRRIVEQVLAIAQARGARPSQVALAWLLAKDPVVAPIVGATSAQHVEDAVGALDLELTEDELTALEADYVPHALVGHS